MKTKIFFFLLSFFMMLHACTSEQQSSEKQEIQKTESKLYLINDDEVNLILDHQSTENDLSSIKATLKEEKNIDLDYSKSTFTKDGKLKRLHIIVDCNDGFKGELEASELTLKRRKQGFRRDYSIRDNIPFHIGDM